MDLDFPIISADSHITEPANTYVDYIDSKWKDKAPVLKDMGEAGDLFFVDGMSKPVPMGLVAAAGKPAEEIRVTGVHFADMHRGDGPRPPTGQRIRHRRSQRSISSDHGDQLCPGVPT